MKSTKNLKTNKQIVKKEIASVLKEVVSGSMVILMIAVASLMLLLAVLLLN